MRKANSMFLRQSLLNIRRSGGRSALFFLMLLFLTVLLCTAAGVSAQISRFFARSEDYFSTVALVEYMGAGYPSTEPYDPAIQDAAAALPADAIRADDAVLLWDPAQRAFGSIAGRAGKNAYSAYRNEAVLVVCAGGYQPLTGLYGATISGILYAHDEGVLGNMIFLNSAGVELEPGHYYLVSGSFYLGRTGYQHFEVQPYENIAAARAGVDCSLEATMLDVTDGDSWKLPERCTAMDIAETLAVQSGSVTVNATGDLEALYAFHEGDYALSEGRGFTAEEYAAGAKVCVLPQELAKALGKGVGDTVHLSVAVEDGCVVTQSYYSAVGFTWEDDYTVVGLCACAAELQNEIFIPARADWDIASASHTGYTLGQIRIRNGEADAFVSRIEPLLPQRVRLTIYDQGYENTARSLSDIKRIAELVLEVCAAVSLLVIALFGYLFVYRQRGSALIMRRLGVPRGGIFAYLLFGCGAIALAAAACGAGLSFALSGLVSAAVQAATSRYTSISAVYSTTSFSVTRAFDLSAVSGAYAFALAGAAVFALCILSCLAFGMLSVRSRPRHRRRLRASGARSVSLRGGAARFAALSIRRDLPRALLPLAACAAAAALLLQLPCTALTAREGLAAYRESTSVKGYFTDVHGREIGSLVVPATAIQDVYASGAVSDLAVSKTEAYRFQFIWQPVDGRQVSEGDPLPSSDSKAYESLMNKISVGADFVYTNDLSATPEFFYSREVNAQYMEGYGPEMFAASEADELCGIVSTDFLEEHGIVLGDVIVVLYLVQGDWGGYYINQRALKVVGSFVRAGVQDNIYCPLAAYYPIDPLLDGSADWEEIRNVVYSAASFTVGSAAKLDALKSFLVEKGYSAVNDVGRVRVFLTIEDRAYLSAVNAMEQRIWYMDWTFPLINGLTLLLAAVVGYLLVYLRRRDIAVMRGQGARASTAFWSIFLEQLALCALGTGAVNALWYFGGRPYLRSGALLCAGFFACWLLGAAFSAIRINRIPLNRMMKAEE